MYTPNGNISKRKTVQLMVALTILAWATETLMHQWGFGAEITPTAQAADALTQTADSRSQATSDFRAAGEVCAG